MCNKAATLVFWTKFSVQHTPPRRGGVSATSKTMDPFRFIADGVVSSARLRRPAELTTNYGFALSRSRFAPVCAAFVASRHFLDGAASFEASPYRARAPRPPLRGGEYEHSSSVQTATSSTFGCGVAALCLLCSFPDFVAGHDHETESFLAIKKDPVHESRGRCDSNNSRHNERQCPKTRSVLGRELMAELAELLCCPPDAGHTERKIAVQFMCQQVPQTADLLNMFDGEP